MHSLLTHILSGYYLQFIVIFYNQNISFVEQGAWKNCTFVQWGYKAFHCVHAVFVSVFQFHALKRHIGLLKKSALNMRKKILHALHFK